MRSPCFLLVGSLFSWISSYCSHIWSQRGKFAHQVSISLYVSPIVSIYNSLCVASKASNSLQAFSKEFLLPFRCCSNGFRQLWTHFPTCFIIKYGHLQYTSLEAACFCIWNFKTIRGSSFNFSLSDHTTCSQNQTGATVPLMIGSSRHEYIQCKKFIQWHFQCK